MPDDVVSHGAAADDVHGACVVVHDPEDPGAAGLEPVDGNPGLLSQARLTRDAGGMEMERTSALRLTASKDPHLKLCPTISSPARGQASANRLGSCPHRWETESTPRPDWLSSNPAPVVGNPQQFRSADVQLYIDPLSAAVANRVDNRLPGNAHHLFTRGTVEITPNAVPAVRFDLHIYPYAEAILQLVGYLTERCSRGGSAGRG